jgi:penicillin-binding protein 2
LTIACGRTGTNSASLHNRAFAGSFICFAPAEDPEIAIAVTVENGKSGSTIMTVAKEMLDYYFSDSFNTSYPYENVLLP